MDGFPPIIVEIVRNCCQFEPSHRPTADEIAEKLIQSQFSNVDDRRATMGSTTLHYIVSKDFTRNAATKLQSPEPMLVNALNYLGESPLMLAKSYPMLKVLLLYERIPSCNTEPSRIQEYHHNVDVFGALLMLTERQNLNQIKFLAKDLPNYKFLKDMFDQAGNRDGQTPLHIASKLGNTELLDDLMDLRLLNIMKTDTNGQTALHVASHGGYAEVIRSILSVQQNHMSKGGMHTSNAQFSNISIANIQDRMGKTALHFAAASGNASACKLLLSFSATKVNLCDKAGQSPIFDSISAENERSPQRCEALQAFLRNPSVRLNLENVSGELIMHKISRIDARTCAQLVLTADFNLHHQEKRLGHTALHTALHELSFGVATILLSQSDVDINFQDKRGNTPLHTLAISASLRGNFTLHANCLQDTLKLIIACSHFKVNKPNCHGDTVLHIAAEMNNPSLMDFLVQVSDIDLNAPNHTTWTPLHILAEKNGVNAAKPLLAQKGVDVNARMRKQCTPLHIAAENDSVEVAEMLVSREEIDLGAHDDTMLTALHYAAKWDSIKVAALLVARKDVNVNALEAGGLTPLHIAAENGSAGVAGVLMLNDAIKPDVRCGIRCSPLHYAAEKNCVEIAKLLVCREDVDVNARMRNNFTPIHIAIAHNSVKVVELLLACADVNLNARRWDGEGEIPLVDVAETHGHAEIVRMLRSRQQKTSEHVQN